MVEGPGKTVPTRWLVFGLFLVQSDRGFFKHISSAMDEEISYDALSGKSFRVVSQSGSRMLCEKVLQRALESEHTASHERTAMALTSANYVFHLAGADHLDGRPMYVLEVDPKTSNKFLYRGRIWVDAEEFPVAKMEVQPARNPSFWISRTLIHHANAQVGNYWLARQNRSETMVRIGGTTVMTIDYGTYQFEDWQRTPDEVSERSTAAQ